MQKQPPSEQKALVVDPEFIVDSSPAEEEDEVLVLDASLEARSASPASSLLPDSPRKEHELFFKEAEKRQEGEERLDRRVERREEVEQAATVDSALWQRGGLPGTTASAFLVPWNRPAVRQTGPRLAAPPVSYAPAAAAAPPVSYAPAAAAAPPVSYAPAALYSSSSSFQSGAFRKPDVVTFKDWRKAARLPPPVARPAEDTISWCGDLYPMGTSMTPPPRPLVPSWSAPRSSTLPPLFSTPALPRALPAPRVPPTRPAGLPPSQPAGLPPSQPAGLPPSQPAGLPPSQPAGLPPSQPAGPPPSQQPAEEFITEFYPAVWRRPRRCFSPTPDHPLLFCRPYGQQRPHVPAPRPYVPAPRPYVPPLPPCLAPSLSYPAPRLCLPPPRPRHTINRENQPATQSRMQRPWRPPGRGTF
nr:vegetative cell wall protein gp1-like [Rhipicephalus microplus]